MNSSSSLAHWVTFLHSYQLNDDNLKIVVDVFEMQDIDFDRYHTAGNLMDMDQVDVFYENEFIDVEME